MVIIKMKQWLRKLRYGGMVDIIDFQTAKINNLQEVSVLLYNRIFDLQFGSRKNQSVYHGPMQELRDCKVLKATKPNAKLNKKMIEVAEFNGYNSVTYYWYFAQEARDIYPDIDAEPPKEDGELFKPAQKTGKALAGKSVKPNGG